MWELLRYMKCTYSADDYGTGYLKKINMKPIKFVTYMFTEWILEGYWALCFYGSPTSQILIAFLAALPITKYLPELRVQAGYLNDKFGLFYWLDPFRVQEYCKKKNEIKNTPCF